MTEPGPTETPKRRFPWGVAAITMVFAAVEPLTHVWIKYLPPEGAVHTGMHVGDSALMQHWMHCIVSDFYSPYASTWMIPDGCDYRLYMVPYFLFYGLFGLLNSVLGIERFLYLGLVNGFGCALYLLAAYAFLRETVPQYARRAFYLFTLGGGLGGVAFVVCWLLGWTNSPDFETNFQRLAHYELIEGQHLNPLLLATRIYYTIPLAAGFYGLTLLLRGLRRERWIPVVCAGLLMGVAGFINLRLGPLFWSLAVAWFIFGSSRPRSHRVAAFLLITFPVLFSVESAWGLMSLTYNFRENAVAITSMATWLIPLLTTTVLFWAAAVPAIRHAVPRMSREVALLVFASMSYLGLYAALYFAYMAYYGNWMHGGDTAAASAVSDASLLGAGLGLAVAAAYLRRRALVPSSSEDRVLSWLTLWLFGFTAVSVSAFGQGWFLQFTPQRFMVFLPLPLAALAAVGLSSMPRGYARALQAMLIACGIVSLIVATLYFQGPLSRQPGKGPFAYLHYEYVTEADAALMEALPKDTVLAPSWSPIYFGEILSLRPGVRVLGGGGGANLSEAPYGEIQPHIDAFFEPETTRRERKHFLVDRRVKAIFCPDTCPVDETVLRQLDESPWLELTASRGKGRVYTVHPAVFRAPE